VAICVKGADLPDSFADELLEWLLINIEQGYSGIFLYFYHDIPLKIRQILRQIKTKHSHEVAMGSFASDS